ncbi:MAG: DUF6206 family protein [Promethearchaeia archaeon]
MEKTFDPYNPEKGNVPLKILGYGEISLVFEIENDVQNIAYKKIPIFDNEAQVKRHLWAYFEYNKLLKRIGFNLPEYDAAWFYDDDGEIQFYCVQEKIHPESICNKVIHNISIKEVEQLILLIMRHFLKVWEFNRDNKILDIGLDGQISNFAIKNFDPDNIKVDENTELYYLDTSTPLFKINGNEAMEAELFLKSAPFFLRPILKALFLEDTVNRYYDFRRVTIDLLANLYKEQCPQYIPYLKRVVNKFFKEEAVGFNIEPLELNEIRDYYKSDAQMWEIFQSVRKLDRFLTTKIFRKKYKFYLPGKIKR